MLKKVLPLAALLLISACGGGGSSGDSGGTTTTTGNGATGLPTPGQADITVQLAAGELTNRVLASQNRQYALFKPTNPTHQKLPLVIWFHGAGGIVWPGIRNDYWVQVAERDKFYVMQPQAINDQYASYTYWNTGLGASKDDAGFVAAALDDVLARDDIDTDRIYVSGMSSGGHMAFYMAQYLQTRVAAAASISGSIAVTPNVLGSYALARPMPLLHIQGTADTIVKLDGDSQFASWASIRDKWLSFNRITAAPTAIALPDSSPSDGSTVTKYKYRGPTIASDIDDYRIVGGGHSIPGIEPQANQDFNAFEAIWAFFQKHRQSDPR